HRRSHISDSYPSTCKRLTPECAERCRPRRTFCLSSRHRSFKTPFFRGHAMKWFMSKQLIALILVVATAACVCSAAYAQIPTAKTKDGDPQEPKDDPKPPPPPPKPEPGAFKGNINGLVASVLRVDSLPGKPSFKVAKVVDVKAGLVKLWNDGRGVLGDNLKKTDLKQIDGHRLYGHKFFFTEATGDNKLFLQLSPKNKSILLGFRLPGNKITCRADVFGFDPHIVITF